MASRRSARTELCLLYCLERSSTRLHTNTYTSCTQSRGPGWRIYCGVEVCELSTNKQLSLSAAAVSLEDLRGAVVAV
jgi:hypothetical protein